MRPRQDCVGRLCDAQAATRPADTLMLSPQGGSASYEDLGRQVRQVVAVLRAQGVARQDCVAVVLPDGPELALCFPAVAAGAVCAPLNPRLSRPEFDFFLEDLHAKAVIVPAAVVPEDEDSPVRASATSRPAPPRRAGSGIHGRRFCLRYTQGQIGDD